MKVLFKILKVLLWPIKSVYIFENWAFDDDPFSSTLTRSAGGLLSGLAFICGAAWLVGAFPGNALVFVLALILPGFLGGYNLLFGSLSAAMHIVWFIMRIGTRDEDTEWYSGGSGGSM